MDSDDKIRAAQCTRTTNTISGTADLFPAALRAIEEDNPDKMKILMELESFDKLSIDSLLHKACERSKDISIEEEYVKNGADLSNSEDEQSMLSICQTSRKNNEKLLDLLLEAESRADANDTVQVSSRKKEFKNCTTPPKPKLRSSEKNDCLVTPTLPKLKSAVYRNLKF